MNRKGLALAKAKPFLLVLARSLPRCIPDLRPFALVRFPERRLVADRYKSAAKVVELLAAASFDPPVVSDSRRRNRTLPVPADFLSVDADRSHNSRPLAFRLALVERSASRRRHFPVFKFGVAFLDSPIAASAAALLFAVHPVHIEDVCWISAANEMIYTGFVLCSLLLLFYGNRQPRPAYIWLSLAAWGAALFAKETTIALLPLFLLLAYFEWPRSYKKNPKTAFAFAAVAAAYLVARWIVLQHL